MSSLKLALVALLLCSSGVGINPPFEAELTWYGNDFLGCRHASSWHGKTPKGFPEVVDSTHFGIAAPLNIPFGTVLKITRIRDINGWPSNYDGSSVYAVVVDRMANYTNTRYFDAWPATARALGFGPSFGKYDAGRILVSISVACCNN